MRKTSNIERAHGGPARKRRRRVAVGIFALAFVAILWPVYPYFAGVRPFILGLPLSLAWLLLWLAVVFATLAWLYRSDR